MKENSAKPKENVKLSRFPEMGNLELMHATYITQKFPKHSHEHFAIGVIENGFLGFYYRGKNVVASPGTINLANPDEPHTGHALDETGWTYRMFYFDPRLLKEAVSEIGDKPGWIPFFQPGVIDDPHLFKIIHDAHLLLSAPNTPLLEKESEFLLMLTKLIIRHSDSTHCLKKIKKESGRVEKVMDYIQEHYHQNISLGELALIAELTPYHFIRVFHKEIGLTPYGYLIQTRIQKAKDFFIKGQTIADTAYNTGFSDQSHLTRYFKKFTGMTPGYYRNIIQDHRFILH